MKGKGHMPKSNLRAVDSEVEHPRERARREIQRWRSNAEQERLPVSNQHDTGAPRLMVDEVLRKSEPNHCGLRRTPVRDSLI